MSGGIHRDVGCPPNARTTDITAKGVIKGGVRYAIPSLPS